MDKLKLLGAMAEKAFTQKKLAAILDVSANTVNNKINGRGCFDTEQAEIICKALDITDGETKANIFLV